MNAPLQGTAEWLSERAGHATASRFKDVLAKIKTGEAATRRNYRIQLVTERLTGQPCESYKNMAMEHGTNTEPFARMAYEERTGAIVHEASFLKHQSITWCGASPDGLINGDGMCEIKCPFVSTVHVETIISGMPREHYPQIQGNLWINGRQWCDFISYDPRMPEKLRLYVERIRRDEDYINTLAREVAAFLSEVQTTIEKLVAL